MAWLFWRKTDDAYTADEALKHIDQNSPITDQHPLPTTPTWQSEGDPDYAPVDEGHPLPVAVASTVQGGLYVSELVEVPGIAAGDALDANDALGGLFVFTGVPEYGILYSASLIDPDDDTLAATLHVYLRRFAAAASDAAFTISAADSLSRVIEVPLTATTDIGGAKTADYININKPYYAPNRTLYCQLSTAGTPNIAAGAMPKVQIAILPRSRWA